MAEVRLQIPDALLEKYKEKTGADVRATKIAEDAMRVFDWAMDERSKGRLILSSDESGEKMTRLAMPILEKAAAGKSKT